MSDTLISPPRTVMEVFKALPEGTLAEVIDNTLLMSPAPSPFHQRILLRLSIGIGSYIKDNSLGEMFMTPVDLYLDEELNAVQPDILFISTDNPLKIEKDGLHGIPDLIIEILSPGNKNHDLVKKKAVYERFGVIEYWIVDPETKLAEGYSLRAGKYELISKPQSGIRSEILRKEFFY